MHVCACVTYSLETDSSGDGIEDRVCMRKVREPSGLDALEVHRLKTEIITCAVNDTLSSTDTFQISTYSDMLLTDFLSKLICYILMCQEIFFFFFFYLHQLSEEIHGYCRAFVEEH